MGVGAAHRHHKEGHRDGEETCQRCRTPQTHVGLRQAGLGHGRHEPEVRAVWHAHTHTHRDTHTYIQTHACPGICRLRFSSFGGQGQLHRLLTLNRVFMCVCVSRVGLRVRTFLTWSWICLSALRMTMRGLVWTHAYRYVYTHTHNTRRHTHVHTHHVYLRIRSVGICSGSNPGKAHTSECVSTVHGMARVKRCARVCVCVCVLLQAAINAAFADDGELLFVGANDNYNQQNVYDAAAAPAMAMDSPTGGRPGSAARRRPDSARRSSKMTNA